MTAVNDWLEHVDELPPRPRTFIEDKYKRYFAVNVNGHEQHDQYLFFAVNGVCVVGLSPIHPLIQQYRQSISYTPLPFTTTQSTPTPDVDAIAEPGADAETGQPTAEIGGDEEEVAPETLPAGSYPTALNHENLSCVNYNVGGKDRSRIKTSGGKRQDRAVHFRPDSIICTVDFITKESLPLWSCISGKLLEVNSRLLEQPKLLLDRPCREGYIAMVYPTDAQRDEAVKNLVPVDEYLKLRGLKAEDLI